MKVITVFMDPFTIGTVSSANMGTIYPASASEQIRLDCSATVSVAAASDGAAVTLAEAAKGNAIIRRDGIIDTAATDASAGYALLNTTLENLQVTVSLTLPTTLDFQYTSSSTPIPVSGISTSGLPVGGLYTTTTDNFTSNHGAG